jgi:LmbE family N-acetylglucosaminyl deacetylase
MSGASYSPLGTLGKHPELWRTQIQALQKLDYTGLKVLSHHTNFFEEERNDIWKSLDEIRQATRPHRVFVNSSDDHQDHATLFREALRVFCKSSIICYPIHGSCQNFSANYYEVLDEEASQRKLDALQCYTMYQKKTYFQNAKARLRTDGTYVCQPYAEAFQIIKMIA